MQYLHGASVERGLYFLAIWYPEREALEVTKVLFPTPGEVEWSSEFHLHLSDDYIGRVIREAWVSGSSLIEAHTHVGPTAQAEFSTSDAYGLRQTVPHMRLRLASAPYCALVFAGNTVAGLAWTGSSDNSRPVIEFYIRDHGYNVDT